MKNIENRPTNASISTMWALKNFPDLNHFFEISRNLGFTRIELNHQVNSSMLSQAKLDHYQFSSVHEPCPADISTRELVERDWLISSINETSRNRGVETVQRSIRLASEIGASTVVVHCGTIPFTLNYENKIRSLFEQGMEKSEEYLAIKSKFIQSRAEMAEEWLIAVKKSLSQLLDFSDSLNVRLGLENRYHYMDIPSLYEMDELLNLADSNRIGFIYDIGHAQALDRLGFYPNDEWLTRYSYRMFGTHIHDVIGVTDHYAPGLGEINYKKIAGFIPETSFRTFELLPGNTLAQVKNGINLLVEAGCIKYL